MNVFSRIHNELRDGIASMKLLPDNKRKYSFFYFLDLLFCELKYGTHPEDYISLWFWNKNAKERKLYLTSGNRKKFGMLFYTKDAFDLLGDKKQFNNKFSKYLKRDWICTDSATKQQIRDFVKSHGKVIVKPLSLSCGEGVEIFNSDEIDSLIRRIESGSFMVEEVLVSHPTMYMLNPDAVQTLRVETCIDRKGEFHLLGCFVMIGAPHAHVSNCHSGGVMCNLNFKTGKIDSDGYNPNGWSVTKSPATGVELHGFSIPYYDKIYDFVKELAYVLPEARYVGWDVAITPDGFAVIEGNSLPGLCTQRVDSVPKLEMLKSYV